VQHVRVDHDPQRQLLQVHQLRYDIRLRLARMMRGELVRLATQEPPSSYDQP